MKKRIPCLLLTLLMFSSEGVADEIMLRNGDRVTGAIVGLEGGELEIQSELLGSLIADWEDIEGLRSDNAFYVRLSDARLLVGSLALNLDTLEIRTRETGIIEVPTGLIESIRSAEQHELFQSRSERLENPGLTDFWSGAIDAALSATSGNADTTAVNVGVQAARTTEDNQFSAYLTTIFADNSISGQSVTTANAIRGGSRYEIRLNDRLFTFGFTDLEFDRFQDLDLRLVLGGGLGFDLIETPRSSLEIFGGASSNQEDFGSGLERKSAESVFGEDLSYQLTSLTSITQRLAVFPNMSDAGEFRLTFDTTAVTRLNDWLSWQVTVSDRFLSNPTPGKKQNDMLFTTGIRIEAGDGALRGTRPGAITVN